MSNHASREVRRKVVKGNPKDPTLPSQRHINLTGKEPQKTKAVTVRGRCEKCDQHNHGVIRLRAVAGYPTKVKSEGTCGNCSAEMIFTYETNKW